MFLSDEWEPLTRTLSDGRVAEIFPMLSGKWRMGIGDGSDFAYDQIF